MSTKSSIKETINNLENYLGDLVWDSVDLDIKITIEGNNDPEVLNEFNNLKYYEQCIRYILAQEYERLEVF